jgi:sulfur carrier protein
VLGPSLTIAVTACYHRRVEIVLNGEPRSLEAETDLAGLVDRLDLPSRRIAVELNGSVVRRSDWPATRVNDGDKLEVVHFVGGG